MTLMVVVSVVAFLVFVWIANRIKALDDRDGPRPGWPADRNRKEWK